MPLTDYRTLGRSGLRVSPLALGAMTFDDGSWGAGPQAATTILDHYLGVGGNFVDTANMYNAGASEEALGRYFAQHPGARDRVVLATKFGGSMVAEDPNSGGAGRKAIHAQLDASLRRLQTDYVDLYWMHQWDRHTPVEETLSTLDDLVSAGKVHAVGFSNTPAWWIAEAMTTAGFRGWAPAAALQVEYSLLARSVEGEVFGAARHFGLGITPWSPLASGVLSGKYSRTTSSVEGSGRTAYAAPHLTEPTFVLLDALAKLAGEHATTVAAVALAWIRRRSAVTSTLIGARTLDQLRANLASLDVELTNEQMTELDALTTPHLDYPYSMVESMVGFQQGNTTVNGLAAEAFVR